MMNGFDVNVDDDLLLTFSPALVSSLSSTSSSSSSFSYPSKKNSGSKVYFNHTPNTSPTAIAAAAAAASEDMSNDILLSPSQKSITAESIDLDDFKSFLEQDLDIFQNFT